MTIAFGVTDGYEYCPSGHQKVYEYWYPFLMKLNCNWAELGPAQLQLVFFLIPDSMIRVNTSQSKLLYAL